MNWRDVFKKYVYIVGECEGTTFIHHSDWTPEEWEEISQALLEIEQEYYG